MERLVWVCVGGAFGSGARYLVSGWVLHRVGSDLPWGTLAVNLVGSYLLALAMVLATETEWMSPTARIALTTGVMGGFTTYSTFSYETFEYFRQGAWALGAANVALTVVSCLVACMLGFATARWMLG